ncbi:MAG TPA: FGGY-family carbohydrate kinase [Aestuariivirga sp.]|nr:FGGY-family carbohydrate kinase [Aestuariivirga sp.]
MAVVLGLDIGTTSTIGILIELPDRIRRLASRAVELRTPHPGWAEEDAMQWWSNVCAITRDLLATSGVAPHDVAAVGVTGMLPATVLLDADDNLLRPSIQQSDGRCGAEVAAMRREWDEGDFIAKAGNGINQQLIGAKLRWIETHEPDVHARIATVFGSYDFINWKLTGRKAIEQNWALEAGFVDISTDALDDRLLRFAHAPHGAVPPKSRSHSILGAVTGAAAAETGLAAGTPVAGGAADLIASALAAGIVNAGDVLLKFGGSVDVLIATSHAAPDPRMFLDYHLVPGLYMPNGCMATGGSGLNWFARTFAGAEASRAAEEGRSVHQHLDGMADQCPAGSDGLIILPYFLGEKTPIHDPAARGVFDGLTFSHTLGHMWRALLESYAYALRHHVEVLNDMGHRTERYIVSDGGSASRVWMQIVADVLQKPVQQLTGHPGSCLGAAWTAAIGAGLTADWSGVSRFVQYGERIEPQSRHAAVYDAGYARYRDLYLRLRDRAPMAAP